MADIIQLLPDAIANQIAAGEVVQRPASVVKELMENAIDAGATSVKLIVKDAGKALIQVIDDGSGMSETDARMSFERHATSKIRAAKDLFEIKTMGFRGEALASMAAVAQVEMRTRPHNQDLGTRLVVEGSEVKLQEACQCNAGTNFCVKNLFFNVPARRNFLKSNTVEMRHIIDEFQRIAIAHPEIFFSLHHNNTEVFHLTAGKLRQRIVGVFGTNSNKKLVPIQEETEALRLYGYIGKPEYAKKTRGEQLFFVNNRFIKSSYLNHAIMGAYEELELLSKKGSYPLYVIFLDIDPARIDINVHPTKQEIKFDDERLVYNYLKVGVRHALGQHNVIPTLDFEQEGSFSPMKNFGGHAAQRQTEMPSDGSGNVRIETFVSKASAGQSDDSWGASSNNFSGGGGSSTSSREKNNLENWQKLYAGLDDLDGDKASNNSEGGDSITIKSKWGEDDYQLDDAGGTFSKQQKQPYQIHGSYIVSQLKSGFLLIDQQAAHERVLYEKYLNLLQNKQTFTQKELFPKNVTVSPMDAVILKDILPEINQLGFDIQEFGKDTFVLHGVPADMKAGVNEQKIIETLLEQYKANVDLKLDIRENIARSMARSSAIKRGQTMTIAEMQELVDKLFGCAVHSKSPSGRSCFLEYDLGELERQFKDGGR
jgi:DNA mismatch repair protein MutL